MHGCFFFTSFVCRAQRKEGDKRIRDCLGSATLETDSNALVVRSLTRTQKLIRKYLNYVSMFALNVCTYYVTNANHINGIILHGEAIGRSIDRSIERTTSKFNMCFNTYLVHNSTTFSDYYKCSFGAVFPNSLSNCNRNDVFPVR